MARPLYKITIDPEYSEGKDLGVEMIAFTKNPAIKVKGMAFNSVAMMSFKDDVKMRIVAPAMIPMNIYRKDEDGEEYDVQFSAEVIEQIHAKFMQNLQNKDIFNIEHDQDKKVPAYILEAWIVEDPKADKAFTSYGIDVPKGTLMLTSQVTDKEYYDKLVESDQVGYSVEGFLGLKLSEHLKTNTMKLPDGEHLIQDNIYVIKDGQVTEIKLKDADKEEEKMDKEDYKKEEEKMEVEDKKEEEKMEEKKEEEQMAVNPELDREAILAIVQPVMEEQVNQLVAMIADLKNQIEEMMSDGEKEEVEVEANELTSAQKFSEYVKFAKTKNK